MNNDVFPQTVEQLAACVEQLRRLIDQPDRVRQEALPPLISGIAACAAGLRAASEALELSIQNRDESALKLTRFSLDCVGDAIFWLGLDGKILYANRAASAMLGYSVDELLAMEVADIGVEGDTEAWNIQWHDARPAGPVRFESKHRTRQGTVFPIEVTAWYLVFEGQTYIQAFVRNITERKQAEERWREQAALLDQARDAIIVRGLDHRIVFWNRGAERIYGWTADEISGQADIDYLYRPEELARLDEVYKKLHATGAWTGEWRHRTKRGDEITVESRWALVRDADDQPKSVLIINTDITEKKELESRLLRAQRLQSLGTLAAGIAHDMNNVLSPVLMAIEALRRRSTDEDDQYFLAMLKLNTERGAALVNQVLSFARGMEGQRTTLQLKYIVQEIVGILMQTLPKNIDFRFFLQEDLWVVDGDATRLNQVVMNLCVNAKDAMPHGGRLSINAENVHLNAGPEGRSGRFVALTISDTGTGMPPHILDKIFEPFFTTKEPGQGTGLGLSTAISIIEAHEGFIEVASEAGAGTTFKVCLPASEAVYFIPDESGRAALPTGNGETLLVVDDEAAILAALREGLGRFGYSVITADRADEAIRLYTANRDRLRAVITDLMMPYRDGYELIGELQRIDPQVKIIATSGLNPNPELMEAVAAQKIYAFVRKPFALDDLLNLLADLLRP